MNIIIVGAGIGGLTAAGLLARQGHTVRVFEQASSLGEVGAGVQMSANAVKVLFRLGLQPGLEAVGVKPEAFEFRRFDTGEMLHRIPLGVSHLEKHGAPYYQVHRGDLHALLVEASNHAAPGAIETGKRVVAVHEDASAASVRFADGSEASADLVIGADGIKSAVRQFVLGSDEPVFTGHVAWRCTVPIERIAPHLRTALVSTVWCGPRNHAVTYYLRSGKLLNFVGCVERAAEDESWTVCRPWSDLDEDYSGWHPMVRAVIDAVDRDQCFRWSLNNRKVPDRWSSARVTLLGDAVHATLPYMAQGAAMAIEDAAVLTRVLEAGLPLEAALVTYHQHRSPRTARVVDESTQMGELYHIIDAAQMRQAFHDRDIGRSRNEWLYPYEPLTAPLQDATYP